MEKPGITAKVHTPTGMTVQISGPKDEVREVLSSITSSRRVVRRSSKPNKETARNNDTKWKTLIADLAAEGFFRGQERRLDEIVSRMNEKGYNVRGRIVGALAAALTLACRDPKIGLQRRHLSKAEQKGKEKWTFFQR